MTDKAALLRKMPIFAGMSEAALAGLAEACRESAAAPGDLILREGTSGAEMFLVGSGRVEVVKRAGTAGETALASLGAGEFFGEMSLIECMIRSASIRCVEPSALYSLRGADLHRLFQRWPDQYAILMINIARDLCRRLRSMDEVFAGRAF